MENKKHISVSYQSDGVDSELDKKITGAMKSIGFTETGAGYLFETQTRDIGFEESEQ